MFNNLLDPVVLFFVLGLVGALLKSDLRLPKDLYDTLSIYLLLAIGLKGGIQLAKADLATILIPLLGCLVLGAIIPVISYAITRRIGKFSIEDSGALAAHYGSVSAVTFAVALEHLNNSGVPYENFTTVFLAVMEIPAILVAILIVRLKSSSRNFDWSKTLHEIFSGRSVFLLIGGMLIGYFANQNQMDPIQMIFLDPFKGILAFFLLELGIMTAQRMHDIRKVGTFLIAFGILMPVLSGTLGILAGWICGLSLGGTIILATLCASASYIAAPAAVKIAIPQANPSYYLTAALGITFPFNLIFGIPLYHWMAETFFRLMKF